MNGLPSLLTLEGVRAGYGPIEAIKGISLEILAGEIVTIVGANGAGKTTTLACISGLIRATAGKVIFDGKEIQNVQAHEIVRLGLSQSPEGRKVFGKLTVLENLEMGAFTRNQRGEIRDDLERNFARFPILYERRRQISGTLSGGEQQMLAVARALMSRPKLLLLDEPSLGLAPLIVKQILDVVQQLNREGMTILLVEQNARLALKLAHRAFVLETGAIVRSGRGPELLDDPDIQKAYLGH